MSDSEEYEYEYDSDEDFDENDDENSMEDDTLIEIENTFYEADDCKLEDLPKSIELFEKVVRLEEENEASNVVKWRFKALENVVLLSYKLKKMELMVERYEKMLNYMSSVTRNECTDSINAILDTISSSADPNIRSKMYEVTLTALKQSNNERLWFNTNVKLGKLYFELEDYTRLPRLIEELHQSCRTAEGDDDPSKATYLLDVYCLEVQLCTATKNSSRMKVIYPKTLGLDGAIADPRIMGVIREEGGKMYMSEQQWTKAYNEFFEAFRNYQEAGNSRAKNCLKYVVLASMLASSDINPFDSREAKVYKDEHEINSMIELRSAYENNEIGRFENILKDKRNHILDDPVMKTSLDPLLSSIRSQVLVQLVLPYQRVYLSHIAEELNITCREVEQLAAQLINDEALNAKIDQTNQILILAKSLRQHGTNMNASMKTSATEPMRTAASGANTTKKTKLTTFESLQSYAIALEKLNNTVLGRLTGC